MIGVELISSCVAYTEIISIMEDKFIDNYSATISVFALKNKAINN